MDWLDLDGKTVVVAGAGGLGAACVNGYLAAGAEVLVADRDEARLAALRAECGVRCRTFQVDLSTADAGDEVVGAALDIWGRIDVALHCIGTNDRRPVLELDIEDWNRMLATNLTSAFVMVQAVGRQMVEQGAGRIVVLSSVSGLLAHRLHAPYAASKGGLNQMMRVMAAEWASRGVAVNAVAPGYVETPLTEEYLARPGVREDLTRLVPAGRLGSPEEVADSVLFLSSARAGFVTGHVLFVDGGRTLV